MFYHAATGKHDRTLPVTLAEMHFAKDGTTLIGGDDGDTAITLFHLPDLFDDELQQQLEDLPPGILNWRRDGHYLVLRIEVDGRSTRELLDKLAATPRAWKLDLSNSGNLTDDELALLEGSPHIYGLHLASIYTDRITAAGVKSLATLPNLQELRIHEPDDEVVREIAGLTQLRVLELNRSEADAETFKLLAGLKELRETKLYLDDGQMDAALSVLAQLPELATLHLVWSGDTEEGPAALGMLPQLRFLTLSSCDNLDSHARLTGLHPAAWDTATARCGAMLNLCAFVQLFPFQDPNQMAAGGLEFVAAVKADCHQVAVVNPLVTLHDFGQLPAAGDIVAAPDGLAGLNGFDRFQSGFRFDKRSRRETGKRQLDQLFWPANTADVLRLKLGLFLRRLEVRLDVLGARLRNFPFGACLIQQGRSPIGRNLPR